MKFSLKITSHIDKGRPDRIKAALDRVIEYGADIIKRRAVQIVPVDTGRLLLSIDIGDIDSKGKSIGPDTPYDIYVEFGTRKMAAQPYMRPALDEAVPKIATRIKEEIRPELK